jgi:hypothetical protein
MAAPTLADLLRVGHDLTTWCPRCQVFGETLRTEDLIARFGPDMLAIDVDARLRCRRCGGKGGETRISVRNMPRMTKLGDDR